MSTHTQVRFQSNFILLEVQKTIPGAIEWASGATQKRTIEHAVTNNTGRDNYGMNIPWCTKKPTRNEKVRRQLRKYILLHAKFAWASGATHKGTIEHAETNNTGRDNYGMNIPWCSKKPTRNEKGQAAVAGTNLIACKIRLGVWRNAQENDRAC